MGEKYTELQKTASTNMADIRKLFLLFLVVILLHSPIITLTMLNDTILNLNYNIT